jgi:hypothetical protein
MAREDVMTCADVFKAIKNKSVNIPNVKVCAIIKNGIVEVVPENLIADDDAMEVKFEDDFLKEWIGVYYLLKKSGL